MFFPRSPRYIGSAMLVFLVLGVYYLWYVRWLEVREALRGISMVPQRVGRLFVQEPLSPQRVSETQSGEFSSEEEGEFVWETGASMGVARTEVAVAELSGRVYVIGGFDGLGRTSSVVERYDPVADVWETIEPLPQPRHHAAAVSLGSKLYVIGGFSGVSFAPHRDVFVYEAGKGWSTGTPLPRPRGAHAAVVVSGIMYAIGGLEDSGISSAVERFDPTSNRWQRLPDLPTPRDHAAAGVIDGKIYVVGGRDRSPSRNLSTLEIFNPETNVWSSGPPMPTPRGGIAAVCPESCQGGDGELYVFGGETRLTTFNQVEIYNPKKNEWRTGPSMPTSRHGLGAAVVGNTMYVIGGGSRPGLSVSSVNEALVREEE